MRRSKGTRQGTRSILKRSKSQRGRLNIQRIMHAYEPGDRVAIVLDGGQQKGMPHRRFQGRTDLSKNSKAGMWLPSRTATCRRPSLHDLSTFAHWSEIHD